MPDLSRAIDLNSQHRNREARPTTRNRLDHSCIPNRKLSSIKRHLPALPSRHSGLLANVRHHRGKFAHFPTATNEAISASISRLLPTQNEVR